MNCGDGGGGVASARMPGKAMEEAGMAAEDRGRGINAVQGEVGKRWSAQM